MKPRNERISIATIAAVVGHILLLAGISFVVSPPSSPAEGKSLSVTLLQANRSERPEDAERRARQDQTAVGTRNPDETDEGVPPDDLASRATPGSDLAPQLQFPESGLEPRDADIASGKEESLLAFDEGQWVVQYSAPQVSRGEQRTTVVPEPRVFAEEQQLQTPEQRIAALWDALQNAVPRPAAFGDIGAEYEENWRRWIQEAGNRHYPEEARRSNLRGSVHLQVIVADTGKLRGLRVVKSSGHKLLDAAALQTIRVAGDYQPFPPELKEKTQRLSFNYEWRFGAQ